MGQKPISQRTIVELMRALREYGLTSTDLEEPVNYTEFLYERDFPDWFVKHAAESYEYGWNWQKILLDMRNGRFFFYHNTYSARVSITDGYLSEDHAKVLGENLIQRLAALGANLPTGEPVLRSLQLDGFDVNNEKLSLVPLEGPVSAREEEDRLTGLVKTSGVPEVPVVLKHIADANSLYTSGKYHPSLNESRNLIQALIDSISIETGKHGNHSTGLPGGTANRIDYLFNIPQRGRKSRLDRRLGKPFCRITSRSARARASTHWAGPCSRIRTTPYAEIRQLEDERILRVLLTSILPLGARVRTPFYGEEEIRARL